MNRCYCPECEKLDQLPTRRQGIPGAYQTTFDHASDGGGRHDTVYHFNVPDPRREKPVDDLPLFGGLEPDLF